MRCTKLETLRLREIDGPLEVRCCYIANLCKALPSAKNLTTIWYLFKRKLKKKFFESNFIYY